jgi:hypothetical protein
MAEDFCIVLWIIQSCFKYLLIELLWIVMRNTWNHGTKLLPQSKGKNKGKKHLFWDSRRLLYCIMNYSVLFQIPLGHVTYTSKQQRLTTKNVLSADNCSHLHLSFFGFERTFYYVLNWHFFVFLKELLDSVLACFFASNDSKTSSEHQKNARWTDNSNNSLKTSADNFLTTAVKFCLFKRQNCRWHGLGLYVIKRRCFEV